MPRTLLLLPETHHSFSALACNPQGRTRPVTTSSMGLLLLLPLGVCLHPQWQTPTARGVPFITHTPVCLTASRTETPSLAQSTLAPMVSSPTQAPPLTQPDQEGSQVVCRLLPLHTLASHPQLTSRQQSTQHQPHSWPQAHSQQISMLLGCTHLLQALHHHMACIHPHTLCQGMACTLHMLPTLLRLHMPTWRGWQQNMLQLPCRMDARHNMLTLTSRHRQPLCTRLKSLLRHPHCTFHPLRPSDGRKNIRESYVIMML